MIPFNVPCTVGTELKWVQAAIENGHISGNGRFGQHCKELLAEAYRFESVFLTHSCTGALEMAAICCGFKPGDEVILPSYTHVGTANAFVRAGATLVFADSSAIHPNVDPASIASLVGPRTRAIVVVHYAGMGCDMDAIGAIVAQHGLILIEDAAHAIGAKYKGRWLGSFGHLAAFSFHETKNITCGQGGMLVVNDRSLEKQASIVWENGTNRAAFFRGEVDQYTWVGMGSCYTLSDLNAAFLYGQLLQRNAILERRLAIWKRYQEVLAPFASKAGFELPVIPAGCEPNGHIFYLRFPGKAIRDQFLAGMRKEGVLAVFHYIPLHSSPYFQSLYSGSGLPACDQWSECLVRLPIYHDLDLSVQLQVIQAVQRTCAAIQHLPQS